MFIDGLGSGGAQRQFSHLARGLARRGHRVTVAVYNDQDHFAGDIKSADIEIVRLPKPSRFSPRPIIGLARLYRARSADVVIAFLRAPAAKAELARILVPGMKVIAAERSAYPAEGLSLRLRILQSLHIFARFITVNSRNQARIMQREFPSLAGRIRTINNGIMLPGQACNRARSAGDGLRLVAMSSLMPYKNSVRLAEAIALLRDGRGLEVTLSWLGETFESMPGYGAYRDTCERLDALGLDEQWRWLGVRQDVGSVLAEHDALIHPSLFEGTSNAVCEAMALGMPVLAGDVADHREMLGETGAGLLFDPLDTRSIAEVIARFAALDEVARREMGLRGREVIRERYSFERMVIEYERLVQLAAGRALAPPAPGSAHSPGEAACAE
jgi:glycosyltransferase involved in cell wall biosynthesis